MSCENYEVFDDEGGVPVGPVAILMGASVGSLVALTAALAGLSLHAVSLSYLGGLAFSSLLIVTLRIRRRVFCWNSSKTVGSD